MNTSTNKRNKKINSMQNYIYFNRVSLCLSIYVFLYPLIAKIIKFFIPTFGICPFRHMTGSECPLCGGTRYVENIGNVFENPSYLLHPFGIMILIIVIEIISRILLLVNIKKVKNEILNKIIFLDVIWHAIIIILFVSYEIAFFLI